MQNISPLMLLVVSTNAIVIVMGTVRLCTERMLWSELLQTDFLPAEFKQGFCINCVLFIALHHIFYLGNGVSKPVSQQTLQRL